VGWSLSTTYVTDLEAVVVEEEEEVVEVEEEVEELDMEFPFDLVKSNFFSVLGGA